MTHVVTETVQNNTFLKHFNIFNVTATQQDIDEFVVIDDESTHVSQKEILEIENFFSEEQQIVDGDENITTDEPMDVDTISQTSQEASTILDNVYTKFVILDGQLSSTDIQAAVYNNYGKI